jgi:hypothetical protein
MLTLHVGGNRVSTVHTWYILYIGIIDSRAEIADQAFLSGR